MLAPLSEVQYGQEELWPLMAAALEHYPEQLAELQRAVRVPTGYWENGTLLVAADPGTAAPSTTSWQSTDPTAWRLSL